MGNPRKQRNLFRRPKNMWQKSRMDEETALMKEYGLRRKQELWKTNGLVSKFSLRAKSLIKSFGGSAEHDKKVLVENLQKLGVLNAGAKVDDVLGIKPRDFLERRLQTIIYRRGYAKTMRQARQFIVHRHVKVDKNVVIAPSYLVKKSEEAIISFNDFSPFFDEAHPERQSKVKPQAAAGNVEEKKSE